MLPEKTTTIIWAFAFMAVGALLSRTWQAPKTVRAERIEIIDSQGQVKAWLGTANDQATLVLIGTNASIGIGTGRPGSTFLESQRKGGHEPADAASVATAFLALSAVAPDGGQNAVVMDVDKARGMLIAQAGRSAFQMGATDSENAPARAAISLNVDNGDGSESFGGAGILATEAGGDVFLHRGEDREAHFRIEDSLTEITATAGEGSSPLWLRFLFGESLVAIRGSKDKEVRFP